MPGSSSGPSGSSNMPGMPPNIPGFSNMLAGMMGAGMGPQPPMKKEVDRSRTKK
jgi:hypothetical protein